MLGSVFSQIPIKNCDSPDFMPQAIHSVSERRIASAVASVAGARPDAVAISLTNKWLPCANMLPAFCFCHLSCMHSRCSIVLSYLFIPLIHSSSFQTISQGDLVYSWPLWVDRLTVVSHVLLAFNSSVNLASVVQLSRNVSICISIERLLHNQPKVNVMGGTFSGAWEYTVPSFPILPVKMMLSKVG